MSNKCGRYKRCPGPFLRDIIGIGADLIGAYAVVVDFLFSGEKLVLPDVEIFSKFIGCKRRKTEFLIRELVGMGLLAIEESGEVSAPLAHRYYDPGARSPLPLETRLRILARDGEVCRYCPSEDGPFHIDHVIPVARGGKDDDENLVVACAPCNLSKGAKLLSEWRPN